MSSATDILIYAARADRDNMAKLNDLIADGTRFEQRAWPVNTGDFAGPNIFTHEVYAFGADGFLGQDLQELVDRIEWKHPEVFVALANFVDHSLDRVETQVIRPTYTIEYGWFGEADVTQEVKP